MAIEIERKFLVTDDRWKAAVESRRHILQFYLTADGLSSVRVRIEDNSRALLTIKAAGCGLARAEFEYEIPVSDAKAMMCLAQGTVLEKVRHVVPFSGHQWEVDCFLGTHIGLVVAEIELDAEDCTPTLPPWIGSEVTHDPQYYNAILARHPAILP